MRFLSTFFLALGLFLNSSPSLADERENFLSLGGEYQRVLEEVGKPGWDVERWDKISSEYIETANEEFLNAWEKAHQTNSKQEDWDWYASFFNEEYIFEHIRWRETFKMTRDQLRDGTFYSDFRNARLVVKEKMVGWDKNVSIVKLETCIQERTEGDYFIDRDQNEIWVLVFDHNGKIRQFILFD